MQPLGCKGSNKDRFLIKREDEYGWQVEDLEGAVENRFQTASERKLDKKTTTRCQFTRKNDCCLNQVCIEHNATLHACMSLLCSVPYLLKDVINGIN
jgi:hypothetical protein